VRELTEDVTLVSFEANTRGKLKVKLFIAKSIINLRNLRLIREINCVAVRAIDLAEDRDRIQVSYSLTRGDFCSSNSVKMNFFDGTINFIKELLLDIFHGGSRVDFDNRLVDVVDCDETFSWVIYGSLNVNSVQPSLHIDDTTAD